MRHDMSVASTTNHRLAAAAAATGLLFLAVAMHQHVAGATPAAAVPVDHVVGGDPGWDVASDVLAWSDDRHFTVGDSLWFAYEAEEDGVAEVGGQAEFASCEVGNPVRMYTNGLSRVGLDGDGARYFVSADPAKCRSGLKLRVDVRAAVLSSGASPQVEEGGTAAMAPAPSALNSSGTSGAAVASLMRGVWCLVSAWCAMFLGA